MNIGDVWTKADIVVTVALSERAAKITKLIKASTKYVGVNQLERFGWRTLIEYLITRKRFTILHLNSHVNSMTIKSFKHTYKI